MIKREKRRYLALKVKSNQLFDEQKVLGAIQASIRRLFGEYGASKANMKLIKGFPENHQFILRCSHIVLEQVRAAIASTVEIEGKTVALHVVRVSGTLRALSKKILK